MRFTKSDPSVSPHISVGTLASTHTASITLPHFEITL